MGQEGWPAGRRSRDTASQSVPIPVAADRTAGQRGRSGPSGRTLQAEPAPATVVSRTRLARRPEAG